MKSRLALLVVPLCLVLLLLGCDNRSGGQGAPGATLSQLAGGGSPVGESEAGWLGELLNYVVLPFLLEGALLAVQISALAMVGGVFLGLGLALMRLSAYAPIRATAWVYIWFVRGTPQLLQLVFLYDALPGIGIKLDTFTTAVIGFALNEAAFSAEIIRGGILSVNRNQTVAAASLGMGPLLALRRIILPQAMRAILPGMANDTIGMIKGTSIASVIFVNELTFRSQQIVGQNFKFFTVFAAAGVIYLMLTSAISLAQAAPRASLQPRTRAVDRRRVELEAVPRMGPVLASRTGGAEAAPAGRGTSPALPRHGPKQRPSDPRTGCFGASTCWRPMRVKPTTTADPSSSATTSASPMAAARSCAISTSPSSAARW